MSVSEIALIELLAEWRALVDDFRGAAAVTPAMHGPSSADERRRLQLVNLRLHMQLLDPADRLVLFHLLERVDRVLEQSLETWRYLHGLRTQAGVAIAQVLQAPLMQPEGWKPLLAAEDVEAFVRHRKLYFKLDGVARALWRHWLQYSHELPGVRIDRDGDRYAVGLAPNR